MKSSVIGSLQAFILARPPVVAFILCVFAITVATFLVAFNIKDKDLILDSHAQEDWNNFLEHLSDQRFCVNISSIKQLSSISMTTQPMFDRIPENSTYLPVKVTSLPFDQSVLMKPSLSGGAIRFSGSFSLKGWKRSCPRHENLNADDTISFTLVIPSRSLDSPENSSSCLYMSKFSELFPAVSSVPTTDSVFLKQCRSLNVLGDKITEISTYNESEDHISISRCQPDNTLQILYESVLKDPEIYLTEVNRMQIFNNLFMVGYFLLGFDAILFLSALIQGRNLLLTRQHSLLPTKEILS